MLKNIKEKERTESQMIRYIRFMGKRNDVIFAIYNNGEGYESVMVHGKVVEHQNGVAIKYKASVMPYRKSIGNKKRRRKNPKKENEYFPLDEEAKALLGCKVAGVIVTYQGQQKSYLIPMPKPIEKDPQSKESIKIMERIQILAFLRTMNVNSIERLNQIIRGAEKAFDEWEKQKKERKNNDN